MEVYNLQLPKFKSYLTIENILGTDATLPYTYSDKFYDIQFSYIDDTSVVLHWSEDFSRLLEAIDLIKTRDTNLDIVNFYVIISEYNTDYISILTDYGFTYSEDSTVGDPGEICMVYKISE